MKKKLGIAIIILLLMGMIGGIAYQMGKNSGTQDSKNSQEGEPAITTPEAIDEEIKVPEKSDNGLSVQVKMGQPWEENGGYSVQIDGIVQNASSQDISGWKVTFSVPEGTKIIQNWNGTSKVIKSEVTVIPADYNQVIGAKSEITFGMIVNSKEKFNVKNATVVANNGAAGSFQDTDKVEQKELTASAEEKDTQGVLSDNSENPVKEHGKLHVKGTQLVDQKGNPYVLKGISTHGIAWFPQYVSTQSFASLKSLFGINAIRLAMYSEPGAGYTKEIHQKVHQGVEAATQLGLYVIIDWHILGDGNPNQYKKEATAFFKEMTKKYATNDNVIYEICNEPNGDVTWERDVKPYAIDMIKTIRAVDPEGVIIVGTPTWSQDVDIVAQSPIEGQKNIMYALHFYAATHKEDLRRKAQKALDCGLPIFVSEFSICDASGNGAIDYGEATQWLQFLRSKKISMMAWNLSNKDESSSLLKPSVTKEKGYEKGDLSETGQWIYKAYH